MCLSSARCMAKFAPCLTIAAAPSNRPALRLPLRFSASRACPKRAINSRWPTKRRLGTSWNIARARRAKRLWRNRSSGRLTLDQLHEQLKVGEVKELPVVVKADVQGSVEVLNEMLPKLSNEQVKLKVILANVGAVNESDVLLASTSGAVIVAFNVKPERKAAELAQREGVDIRSYTIIYELLDELHKAVAGLLAPIIKEQHLGRAEVRDTFRVKGVGTIAGCSVTEGIIRRDAEVRVIRDGVVFYRPHQFAETLQGRREGSSPGFRMRHRYCEFRGRQGGRQYRVLQGRKDRSTPPPPPPRPRRRVRGA